jgi:hypothetical protein
MPQKRSNPGAGGAEARGSHHDRAGWLTPEYTTACALDAIAISISRAFGHDVSPLLIVLWWGVAR